MPPPLVIDPPLVNTANPWATNIDNLTALYDCPYTGAVTTRTSMLHGFGHDPTIHQFVLFDPAAHTPAAPSAEPLAPVASANAHETSSASLNCLGYSPFPLDVYLGFVTAIATRPQTASRVKPKGFLVSVTGTPEDVAACYARIVACHTALPAAVQPLVPLAMEVNLSCPNIPNKPPPAYDGTALLEYLQTLQKAILAAGKAALPIGLKTPPYTHAGEFRVLIDALLNVAKASPDGVCPISFLTATNTLGTCLVLQPGAVSTDANPSLPGLGFGGMAGAPLHPLALGNVATLHRLLDESPAALGHIRVVGAGGVSDAAGFDRMRSVGAYAVGVGTGLGLHGVPVFDKIAAGAKLWGKKDDAPTAARL